MSRFNKSLNFLSLKSINDSIKLVSCSKFSNDSNFSFLELLLFDDVLELLEDFFLGSTTTLNTFNTFFLYFGKTCLLNNVDINFGFFANLINICFISSSLLPSNLDSILLINNVLVSFSIFIN